MMIDLYALDDNLYYYPEQIYRLILLRTEAVQIVNFLTL